MALQEQTLEKLDAQIQAKHLLKHPFYQAWSQGKLSLECLKEYAREYYVHVKKFPMYLSAVHSHTDDMHTRKLLLQNLIEEEHGTPNHPDLWRSFAMSLGNTNEDIDSHVPSQEMQLLVDDFLAICKEKSSCAGIAALYAYESQIPEISTSKIEGLKQFYGMQDPNSWKYFSVHIEADKEHAAVERDLLKQHFTDQNSQEALAAADKVLDRLWNFLSYLCHRYDIACA